MNRKGRYGQFIRGIFTAVDFIVLNIVYLIVCLWSDDSDAFFKKQIWFMLNISFFVVGYFFSGIHKERIIYADKVILQAVKFIILDAIVFFALISFMDADFSAISIFVKFYIVLFIALSIWWIGSRKLMKWYRKLGFNFKRIIIIGGGKIGVKLLDELMSDAGYGYKIMGFFDDNKRAQSVKNYKGSIDDVEGFIKENMIDEMYCTLPGDKDDVMIRLIKIAEKNAVDFLYVPQISHNITRRFELSSVGNVPVLSLRPNPLNNVMNIFIKRVADFLFSSVVLILSPVILLPVATAIKLSSKGPIFFKQKRTGYRGEEFTCYKFRTMRVNNDSDKKQATKNDPRKTKVGEFLRKTSIDELPQFYNVWRGDMSIVGPRPHMVKHTQDYSAIIDKYMLRHIVKPGITGWAQVNGYRGQTERVWQMEKRVEYDVWYTENWNLMLDVKIVFLTVYNALCGEKNAF